MTADDVEQIALSFPETEAGFSYRQPCWKAFGKFLTRIRPQDNSVVLSCVPIDERSMLIEIDPATFHFTDHYKNFPYVLARVGSLEPAQLRSFLTRAWRKNAPKAYLKAWDAAHRREG
jgi:hypothetical protein